MQSEIQPLRMLHNINQGSKRTHTFDIDATEYGEKFKGKFTVHHPSQMETMRIGILQSQLTGGVVPMDTRTSNLVLIISTLDTVLDSKPEWFDVYSEDLEYEVLQMVYLEYRDWHDSFRRERQQLRDREVSTDTEGTV